VKKNIDSSNSKAEKKITKMLIGKEKIKIDKLWNEEKLERVLF
jgi:hypothetical protein